MFNNGFKNNDVPVKDTDGNVISKEVEKLARWKEHFESILNRPEPELRFNRQWRTWISV